MENVHVNPYTREKLTEDVLKEWQNLLDSSVEIFDVVAGLITRVDGNQIEILLSSESKGNPYTAGYTTHYPDSGWFCERTLKLRNLNLIKNALENPEWKDNAAVVSHNMISYAGLPIQCPDGGLFGTICFLDIRSNPLNEMHIKMLHQMRRMIELSLCIIYDRDVMERQNRLVSESARRASEIIDFFPDPTFAIDFTGKVIFWNKAAEELTGAKDMLGKGKHEYEMLFRGIQKPLLIEQAMGVAVVDEKDFNFIEKDGDVLLVEAGLTLKGKSLVLWGKAAPLRDEHGNIIGAIQTFHDITGSKEVEKNLGRSESILRSVFETVPVGLCIMKDRVFQSVNRAWVKTYGYSEADMIGQSPRILYENEEEYERVARELYTDLPERGLTSVQTVNRRKNGEISHVILTASPLQLDGRFSGMALVTVEDITERKRTEEALEKRIIALTRPIDDIASIDFEDLVDLFAIQYIQDMLAVSLGVAIQFIHPDGTDITQPSSLTYFCNDFTPKHEKGLVSCRRCIAESGQSSPSRTFFKKCEIAGLWVAGTKIMVGGRHIASSLVGQVRCETPDDRQIIEFAHNISADEAAFRQAFLKVPVMSEEKFNQTANTVFALANQLSTIAYQNIQQARFITEQKQAEKALRESEIKYRRLHESMRDAFVSVDMNGCILESNLAYQSMLGYSAEELCRLKYEDITPAKWHAFEKDIIKKQILVHGYSEVYEKEYKRKGGSIFPVELRVFLIRDDDNNPAGMWAIVRDISDRKRTEKKLEDQRRLLENTNKELESFSYSISHDLRVPLRAIDGFSRMILKKQGAEFNDDTREKFDVIRRNTKMMGHQIDALLELSRLGRISMSMSVINMDDLIKEIWEELEIINPDRKISLTVNTSPQAYGDRQLLRLVCSNLLSNAVKFTKNKNVALIETGGFTDEANGNIYYVKDNGDGFDMSYANKLFGVFQRLHSTEEFEGSGIGLATVQRIINKHGGRVWAEGGIDKGATFYFLLPIC